MNEVLSTIRMLRSTHWEFSDRPVARGDIETIIQHSLHAANNSDRMDMSVIVVDDPEVLGAISGGETEGRSVPTMIFLLDHTRIFECAKRLGHSYVPNGKLYSLLYSLHDISAAAQTAVIAAKSMGIDSLITNFMHRHDMAKLRELLNLPQKYCFPVIAVALGYRTAADSVRREYSAESVIHWGAYRKYADAEIDGVISQMDARYPECVNEQHAHALDWFFTEWWIEHYDEQIHRALSDDFARTGFLRERAGRRMQVIEDYSSANSEPIELATGDTVRLGETTDPSGDYPNWIFCTSERTGRTGWVAMDALKMSGDIGTALREYSAREMSVSAGDIVEVIYELNGWYWCCRDGERGWVDKKNLR